MDCNETKTFFSEFVRLCSGNRSNCKDSFGNECPMLNLCCMSDLMANTEKAVEIVQKWSDEHPLPKPKTYADDFFEKFPNAPKSGIGHPKPCITNVYGDIGKECIIEGCKDCWNTPMPA